VVDTFVRAIETSDFERRLQLVEADYADHSDAAGRRNGAGSGPTNLQESIWLLISCRNSQERSSTQFRIVVRESPRVGSRGASTSRHYHRLDPIKSGHDDRFSVEIVALSGGWVPRQGLLGPAQGQHASKPDISGGRGRQNGRRNPLRGARFGINP